MADGWALECEGRGDGTRCPTGETLTVDAGISVYRCDECRGFWELDELEPSRRVGDGGGSRGACFGGM